jgi:hypothetical protein
MRRPLHSLPLPFSGSSDAHSTSIRDSGSDPQSATPSRSTKTSSPRGSKNSGSGLSAVCTSLRLTLPLPPAWKQV